ncbi:MAG: class I SAM-dependent methyltransferase [Halobacteriota archaeon]|jgi:SAM-dependent methyltransferase
MGSGSKEDDDDLARRLRQVCQLFDVPQIINEPQGKQQIIDYYVATRIVQVLYDRDGFFHFGISYDGKHKRGDLKEPARLVEKYFHDVDAGHVLELAYGLGANSAFLARRNPQILFDAIDISNKPLRRNTTSPNLRFRFCDYHNLSALPEDFYDLVFVIESLCCSTDKPHVLREVKTRLRPGGLFIVIDGYRRECAGGLSSSEQTMWALIEKGLSCDKIESITDVESYMRKEFLIVERRDFSQNVLPSVMRLNFIARLYFNNPVFARAVNTLVPFDVVKNCIHLMLLPISIRSEIGCYYLHVLKKDE